MVKTSLDYAVADKRVSCFGKDNKIFFHKYRTPTLNTDMENAIKPRVLVENSLGDMHLTKCVLVAGKTQEHYGQLPAESQLWRQ